MIKLVKILNVLLTKLGPPEPSIPPKEASNQHAEKLSEPAEDSDEINEEESVSKKIETYSVAEKENIC